ncbi:hypothetical protein BC833DRAFT_302584 [Globomyces pollinis-pini]|nr:hypothetical protein BC833DRAFT_302584 [Globomyces pollinis-pini]
MLSDAVNNLQIAFDQTEKQILNLESQSIELHKELYPASINPANILSRIEKIQNNMIKYKETAEMIEIQKKDLALKISSSLEENKMLMERILNVTNFSGDFDELVKFQQLAEQITK